MHASSVQATCAPRVDDLPDEITCMILRHVLPLWRPMASQACSAWMRCAMELERDQVRAQEKSDGPRRPVYSVTRLTTATVESKEVLSRPRVVSWLLDTQGYPHRAWLIEASARCGLIETVHAIVAHEAHKEGIGGVLGLLDGGVLANIALHCGGVSTLRTLCNMYRIKRLDRRNMAWAVTVAVVAGDVQLLQFLARMHCPYDITTAIAACIMEDAQTWRLFRISSDMIDYAADIVQRAAHCRQLSHDDTYGCLLTRIVMVINHHNAHSPRVLVAGLLADGVRFAAETCSQGAHTFDPGTDLRRGYLSYDYNTGLLDLHSAPTACCTSAAAPSGRREHWIHAETWGFRGNGGAGCDRSDCSLWHCCGGRALDNVYDPDTVGNASVADSIWIPPLLQRWQQRVPDLRLLFRYPISLGEIA